jgi:hypothetical protein
LDAAQPRHRSARRSGGRARLRQPGACPEQGRRLRSQDRHVHHVRDEPVLELRHQQPVLHRQRSDRVPALWQVHRQDGLGRQDRLDQAEEDEQREDRVGVLPLLRVRRIRLRLGQVQVERPDQAARSYDSDRRRGSEAQRGPHRRHRQHARARAALREEGRSPAEQLTLLSRVRGFIRIPAPLSTNT